MFSPWSHHHNYSPGDLQYRTHEPKVKESFLVAQNLFPEMFYFWAPLAAHPQHLCSLFTGQSQDQTEASPWKPDSHGLPCPCTSCVCLSLRTNDESIKYGPITLTGDLLANLWNCSLSLEGVRKRHSSPPPHSPSSSIDGLGLSACQLSLGTVWHKSTSEQWKSVCSQIFQ